ncbi:hypothetical protein [Natronomonas sp.]|uniref:hypothetical protein n=1 Tax=Natronomonas sp. TaxID=2184060 RepID=UPI002FC2898F
MSNERYADRFRVAVSRTREATALTLRRRDSLSVFGVVTVAYLVAYLWAIGHLAPGLGGFGITVVSDPLAKFLRPELGPFTFTPIAVVAFGPVTYLLSFNTVLGIALAVLVGLNLSLTYLAWTQPKACGIGQSSTGIFASVPALVSGAACCGPVILFVLGIQASSVLLTAFQFMLPVAAALLVGSLILVGRQVDPHAVREPSY